MAKDGPIILFVKAADYQQYNDSDLIGLLREGDHLAYMEIYNRYARSLYVKGCKKLDSRDDVKDLLQDVFAALWKNRYALTLNTPLAGYLYATLRYMVIKRILHKKVQTTYLESLKSATPIKHETADNLARENELKRLIETEITSLPEKMQEVFRMSREHHLSHREIAVQLGLSEATVKKHVNNALKSLRIKLGTLVLAACIYLGTYFF
ncbi:sigma-70 family RNA polymerase sigma factor [Niabella sp. CC-SYL272]|uniref:RNA polymerase sigma factor n=1 Tax=Niabella agricola TaxID=2891571 RepID=UPI001F1BEEE8|nr:sigma-70 family RNA polymerase sigma factor [Niabella agricola]MCF3110639.1 sigma-70 family RNA polymerase sigma factor [Niabella agricola]